MMLNQTVTFNDVIHAVGDKSKIITEPSVYVKGEDIVFNDDYYGSVTLSFFEDTQILQGVQVSNIPGNDKLNQLKESVLKQWGDPELGVEAESIFDVKEDDIMSDFSSLEFRYYYKNHSDLISVGGMQTSVRINPKSLPDMKADVLSKDAISILKIFYEKTGFGKDAFQVGPLYHYSIFSRELKSYDTFPPGGESYENYSSTFDTHWAKITSRIVKKW